MMNQTEIHIERRSFGFSGRRSAARSLSGRLVGHVGGIVKAFSDRRQMKRLFTMSDHDLKDLGVTRNDVDREIMKPIRWW